MIRYYLNSLTTYKDIGYKSKNIFQNIKTEVEKNVMTLFSFCIVLNIEWIRFESFERDKRDLFCQ
ncbi:hypothetical protein FNW54_09885 [Bacteroides sp. HF-5092]|nr:hypothetical protein FNW54_09885 [Bacteroides sp. HF-5092]